MRYLKVKTGKVHLAKDDAQRTLCGYDIKYLWADEIPAQHLWTFRTLCKRCEASAHKICASGRQTNL